MRYVITWLSVPVRLALITHDCAETYLNGRRDFVTVEMYKRVQAHWRWLVVDSSGADPADTGRF